MAVTYELGISSVDAITVYPEYNYSPHDDQERSDIRAKDGTLYQYQYYAYNKFDVSLEWLPASDAALINSWYDTNVDLIWFVTSNNDTEATTVRIMNNEKPIADFQAPYIEYYKGKLSLEATVGK